MAKKITQKQVVQTDLWQNTIDSTKVLLDLQKMYNEELAKTAKISKKALNEANDVDFDGLKEVNEEIEKLNDSFEQKIKIDKQRVTLEAKLNKVEEQSVKTLSELEVKTKQLTAAKNDLIKRQIQSDKQRRAGNEDIAEAIKLTKQEEEELSKLTTELTVANLQKAQATKLNKEQLKDIVGLTDTYQKQSKKLNQLRKDFKNLRLEEGKSTKETERLAREIEKLDKELKDVDAAAGQFQRNVGNYPEVVGNATNSLIGLAAAAGGVALSLDGVLDAVSSTEEGLEKTRKAQAGLNGVWQQTKNVVSSFVLDSYDNVKIAITQQIGSTEDLLEVLDDTEIGFQKTGRATDDFGNKVKDSVEANIALEESLIAFEKAIRPLEISIARLNGLISEQQIIAGDSTRSFEQINAAILKGQSLQVKRAAINIKIAKEELSIAQERIRVAELSSATTQVLRDQETAAITKLIDAENELKNEILENEKEIRQVKQDRLEIDLDILIDGFDNQKTINERIIANEKETLEVRAALLERTNKLAEESFKGQKEVLEELSAAGINVDDLLLLDATELAKQIRLLEQSEIINTRTLEVIRERKIVLQDLKDAQDELNESQQESIDLQADILAQEEALGKQSEEGREDLEKTREENNIASLQRRLELAKKGSIEEERIQQELNDALLDQQASRLKEEQEQDDKRQAIVDAQLKKEAENREKVLTTLNELNDKFFNDRIEKVDEEISANQAREDELKSLAAQGNADAAASLAQNQKDQAEANRKKEELLQKEKQFELALAVISAFNAELNSGKTTSQALTSAITSTTVLSSFVQSLPAFYDGTEDTGTGGRLDSNGGFHAMLHDNERVIDKKNNAKMGGVSNDDAANIVHDFNNDLLSYNAPQLSVEASPYDSSEQVLKRFDKLEKSVVSAINDKPVYMGGDWDSLRGYLERKSKKGNTTTVTKSRFRG